MDKKSREGETSVRLCNYTDVYYHETIRPTMEFMPATATQAQLSDFSLRHGDVILTKDSETADDVGIPAFVEDPPTDLVCGYHLTLVRPNQQRLDGRFLFWQMSATHVRQRWEATAAGVTRVGLRAETMATLPILVPVLAQQRAIADFLDTETARIDALIEKKCRLAEALEDRFQSRLSIALWRSTVDRVRLKYLCGLPTSGNRDHQSFTDDDEGVPCLRGLNIRPGRVQREDLRFISPEAHQAQSATRLRVGDVVVVRSGLAGSAAAIPDDLDDCNCVDLVVVRRSPAVNPRWLEYVLNSREAQEQVATRQAGAILTHFNAVDAGNVEVPAHDMATQNAVVQHLDAERSRRDLVSAKLRRQIELLREHRQALITAAVTGELEVPGVAV